MRHTINLKTIYLMRHASVDYMTIEPDIISLEPSVSQEGKQECNHQKSVLNDAFNNIDFVVCSTKLRTRQTAQFMVSPTSVPLPVSKFREESSSVGSVVCSLPDTAHCVLMVGHQPMIENFVKNGVLFPRQSRWFAELTQIMAQPNAKGSKGFPHAGIIRIDHKGDWKNFPRDSSVAWVQFPGMPLIMTGASSVREMLPKPAASRLEGNSNS